MHVLTFSFTDHFTTSGPGRAVSWVCVCPCVQTIVFLATWPLTWIFGMLVHLDTIWIKVISQSSRSLEKNVAKVVSVTLSEGFLVAELPGLNSGS